MEEEGDVYTPEDLETDHGRGPAEQPQGEAGGEASL